MRIAYDVRPFLRFETGVGVYLKNLLFNLAQIDKSNEYYLLSSSFKDRFQTEKIPPFSHMSFRDFRIPTKAVNFAWNFLKWPPLDKIFRARLDLTHSGTPLILPTHGKKIITIYDLFFLQHPRLVGKEVRRAFLNKLPSSLSKADGIIAISHFIKQQLLERFPLPEKKIKVIHLGIEHKKEKPLNQEELDKVRKKYSLPDSFLLFIGTHEPRKNLVALIEALTVLHHSKKNRIALVIAGRKGPDTPKIRDKITEKGLESSVFQIGYVSDSEKKALYQMARALVFPSLCEGFGLPLIEAMSHSLPVVASKGSAISEVGSKAAVYFDPKDPEEMADRILRILENSDMRKKMISLGHDRAAQFGWKQTAAQTLSYYQEVVEPHSL